MATLGLATIVSPMLGALTPAVSTADSTAQRPVEKTVSRAATVLAWAPGAPTGFTVSQAQEVTEPAPEALVAEGAEALSAQELNALRSQAVKASRNQARAALADCDGKPITFEASNGRLDTGDLCQLWKRGLFLRADAAVSLARLNAEYATTFGSDICITDAYRSYSAQVSVRGRKPGLAARPGTSQHGWGVAVDACGNAANPGTAEGKWLLANGPDFGWDNPDWARPGGSGPTEPWHWEFSAPTAG